MNKFFITLLLLSIAFFSLWRNAVFGASGETLKQLDSNIKELKETRENLDEKWSSFKQQYIWGVMAFVKEDLSTEEKQSLQDIIYIYNSKRKELDLKLIEKVKELNNTQELKQKLIELKKTFYNDVSIYVAHEKIDSFLEYIKGDIELNEKNKEVKEKLYKKSIIFKEKVDSIKGKIEENKKTLDERLYNLIKQKLSEKIVSLEAKEKYKNFTFEEKVILFEKILAKAKTKKQELEIRFKVTASIEKKIEIYTVIEQVLVEKILSIQKEESSLKEEDTFQ